MSNKIIATIVIAFVAIVVIMRHDITTMLDDEVSSQPYNFEARVEQVENVSIEFTDAGVQLTVKLKKAMTCDELVDALEIRPFILKDKTYYPSCTVSKNKLIKVIYKQYTAA